MPPTTADLWAFLPWGYLWSVLIETPILLFGLSPHHPTKRRIFAGFWLTACTYPIVALVLPIVVWEPFGRTAYLAVAETFAPIAECALFYAAFGRESITPMRPWRDFATIIAANLASFGLGEVFNTTLG